MARVFISYCHKDVDKAKAMAEALEGRGYDVWWDKALLGGQNFTNEIARRLKEVDAVIVLWTSNCLDSEWVMREAGLGMEYNCLLPVRYDAGLEPAKMFGHLHVEYLGDWHGRKQAPEIDRLVAGIVALKHQHDKTKAINALPAGVKDVVEKTNLLSVLFDTALPGGLPVYRFAIGVILCVLGLWGLLYLIGASDDFDEEEIIFVTAAIAASRAIDQYLVAGRKQVSVRFFDPSFAQACAVCLLLTVIILTTASMLGAAVSGVAEIASLTAWIAPTMLIFGYAGVFVMLMCRSLARRL